MKDNFLSVMMSEETLTWEDIGQKYGISEQLIIEMIEQGIFVDLIHRPEKRVFHLRAVQRMEKAFRLHRDFDLNLPAVALVLSLLDEMKKLRQELEILKK